MRVMRHLVLGLVLATFGCGPTIDLSKALQIEVVDTGWFDVGIVNGQNKLVPAARITVKNNSDQKLVQLQINSLFRQGDATEEWGSAFITAAGSDGLAPGATTSPLLLKSQNGYTGTDQSRQEMLQNSHFVDAKIQLFAKYGSVQWVRMGERQIERKLLEK
ncbi:MAG TPA: hypothetical protein VH497_16405 [Vicinamibacterales bacterium]|jgi:hypothetical protein